MSRRGNGEGSIYQRKDGRWEGALTLPSGGRRSFYGRTRRDVQAKLQSALRDLQQGLPLTTEKQSTGEYLHLWLDGARATLAATTWQRYEVLVRVHAIPHLGHVPLARLTPQHLQKLYADRLAAKSDLPPSTSSMQCCIALSSRRRAGGSCRGTSLRS